MAKQAVVHLYDDDVTTGWIIRIGNNLSVDPDVEVIVSLNVGEDPDPNKPWWRQRVDAGVISTITDSDEKTASREWLHTKYQAGKRNHMYAHESQLEILDDTPVEIGKFVSDGSSGVGGGDEGGASDRVFGVMFWWQCPVEGIVPDINLYALDEDAAETVKKTRQLLGRAYNTKDDTTDRRQLWKMVTYKKEPQKFFKWKLEVTATGLTGSDKCYLEALTLSTGRRGAD